jgi:hypothetical protein
MRLATKYVHPTRNSSAHGITDYRIVEALVRPRGAGGRTAELIVDITTTAPRSPPMG